MTDTRWVRVLAAIFAVWWGFFFYGLIDLAVPLDQTPGFYDSYLLETGWGALFTFLVAAPLLALAVSPRLVAPLLQLMAVAVAVIATAVITPALPQLWAGLGLLLTAGIIGVVARRVLVWRGLGSLHRNVSRWLLLGALIATPPAMWFAGEMIAAARDGRYPVDETIGIDHWPMQAALALAIPLVAVTAALRQHGWHVCTWTVGTTSGWLGVFSMIYPDHAGSLGTGLGAGSVGWGIAIVGLGELQRLTQRDATTPVPDSRHQPA